MRLPGSNIPLDVSVIFQLARREASRLVPKKTTILLMRGILLDIVKIIAVRLTFFEMI
jgi:hypothetical protein